MSLPNPECQAPGSPLTSHTQTRRPAIVRQPSYPRHPHAPPLRPVYLSCHAPPLSPKPRPTPLHYTPPWSLLTQAPPMPTTSHLLARQAQGTPLVHNPRKNSTVPCCFYCTTTLLPKAPPRPPPRAAYLSRNTPPCAQTTSCLRVHHDPSTPGTPRPSPTPSMPFVSYSLLPQTTACPRCTTTLLPRHPHARHDGQFRRPPAAAAGLPAPRAVRHQRLRVAGCRTAPAGGLPAGGAAAAHAAAAGHHGPVGAEVHVY